MDYTMLVIWSTWSDHIHNIKDGMTITWGLFEEQKCYESTDIKAQLGYVIMF